MKDSKVFSKIKQQRNNLLSSDFFIIPQEMKDKMQMSSLMQKVKELENEIENANDRYDEMKDEMSKRIQSEKILTKEMEEEWKLKYEEYVIRDKDVVLQIENASEKLNKMEYKVKMLEHKVEELIQVNENMKDEFTCKESVIEKQLREVITFLSEVIVNIKNGSDICDKGNDDEKDKYNEKFFEYKTYGMNCSLKRHISDETEKEESDVQYKTKKNAKCWIRKDIQKEKGNKSIDDYVLKSKNVSDIDKSFSSTDDIQITPLQHNQSKPNKPNLHSIIEEDNTNKQPSTSNKDIIILDPSSHSSTPSLIEPPKPIFSISKHPKPSSPPPSTPKSFYDLSF